MRENTLDIINYTETADGVRRRHDDKQYFIRNIRQIHGAIIASILMKKKNKISPVAVFFTPITGILLTFDKL